MTAPGSLLARGFDTQSGEFIWYYRDPESDDWVEFQRQHEDSFDQFRVWGRDPSVPGNFIVEANNGSDTTGLWSFDPKSRKYAELLYQRKDNDICSVQYHAMAGPTIGKSPASSTVARS